MKIDIQQKYSRDVLPFKSGNRDVDKPILDVVLKNKETGYIMPISNKFIVDTGASISIINSKYTSFIETYDKPSDSIKIQFVMVLLFMVSVLSVSEVREEEQIILL
jgi:hypothetical protein